MPFQLHVEACTPIGKFTGFLSGDLETFEDAIVARDEMQDLLRKLDMVTMFCDQVPGTEITLNEGVIKNSVFVMKVTNFPKSE